MKNVLLIGSGSRIENNFIPAFKCLTEVYSLAGVYSRKPENIRRISEAYSIPPVLDLKEVDWDSIQLVVISITTKNVGQVLRQIATYAPKLSLLIDTPVLSRFDPRAIGVLRSFRSVRVAEDFASFPQYELMRKAVHSGLIGRPREVCMFHSGYKYHAVALARSIFGGDKPYMVRTKRYGSIFQIRDLRFKGGRRALISEPYFKGAGYIIIDGEKGAIQDFASPLNGGKPTYHLVRREEGGALVGFSLMDPSGKEHCSYAPPYLTLLRGMEIPNNSEFNLLKTCGLIEVIRSFEEDNINRCCLLSDGLHDGLKLSIADRLGLWISFLK